jgi:hypothetical protein
MSGKSLGGDAAIGQQRHRTNSSDAPKIVMLLTSPARCRLDCPMIWFFDRDGERLRYEISRGRSEEGYRVIITRPDGSESIEEVKEPTELIERSVQLMNALRGDGWKVA